MKEPTVSVFSPYFQSIFFRSALWIMMSNKVDIIKISIRKLIPLKSTYRVNPIK